MNEDMLDKNFISWDCHYKNHKICNGNVYYDGCKCECDCHKLELTEKGNWEK
jgi:hypothetical protein